MFVVVVISIHRSSSVGESRTLDPFLEANLELVLGDATIPVCIQRGTEAHDLVFKVRLPNGSSGGESLVNVMAVLAYLSCKVWIFGNTQAEGSELVQIHRSAPILVNKGP